MHMLVSVASVCYLRELTSVLVGVKARTRQGVTDVKIRWVLLPDGKERHTIGCETCALDSMRAYATIYLVTCKISGQAKSPIVGQGPTEALAAVDLSAKLEEAGLT